MLSVAYFNHLAQKSPARFADMARAMGQNVDALPEQQRPAAFIRALEKLIADIGLKQEKLSDYGVKPEDLDKLARNSFETMGKLYELTPVKMTVEDVAAIFENAYA
jgi:alcohol dehydrogenase